MTRIAIIADDLTGALDSAAPFAAARAGVVVATGPGALAAALATRAEVVAVSTRTREGDAGAARQAVADVLARFASGVRIVKKVDSRLKGNVAAELEALGDVPLVVVPAVPEFGRVVRDGALQGFGVGEAVPVRPALGRFAAMAEVPDVVSEADMRDAVRAAPLEAVLVGARGMTQALAELLGFARAPEVSPLPQPLCIVVGSTDPITLAQVACLREGGPGLRHVVGPAGELPAPKGRLSGVTLVQTADGAETRPGVVAATFAATAEPYLRGARSMLLTGGATAEAVLDTLGIGLLRVAGEALPGVVACRAGDQVVVTKSGGFGERDALLRLALPQNVIPEG